MLRLIWRGLLFCVAGGFGIFAAIVIITEAVRHFSWPQLRADVRAFVEAVTSGDLMLTMAALVSPPVLVAMLVVGCAVGALLGRVIGPPKE
jgi:hypothetical protein